MPNSFLPVQINNNNDNTQENHYITFLYQIKLITQLKYLITFERFYIESLLLKKK